MTAPNHSGWLEIAIHVHPVAHEAVSAFLFDLGCEGVVSEDFHDRRIKAYLPLQGDLEDIQNRIHDFLHNLEKIFPEVRPFKLSFCDIEDRDWNRNWRRFFRPDRVTPNLMILPAWEPVPDQAEGTIIRIDPGPAFGTGQHPTTRMCLEAMETVPLPDSWTMLDVGTGSGILAVYAARLGARKISAIDIDPEALRWAERNIALNSLSGRIELSSKPLSAWTEAFSLVAANLILGTILELFPLFPPLLEPRGWLLLSGILTEQVAQVTEALTGHGLDRDRVLHQGEWACVIARKN